MPDSPETMLVELTEQIREEVGGIVLALDALVGTMDSVMVDQVHARAPMWAAGLLGDDDKLAAQTVIDLMNVLWPSADPPTAWWSTPLGRAFARSVGHPGADVVSYSVAGAMLGCTKQYVGKLVKAGRLVPGPTGGVTTASVRVAARTLANRS